MKRPRKFDPEKHCGAKNRQGNPCRNRKGWKTDHFGEGRCRLHGGVTGRHLKTGEQSAVHKFRIRDRIEQFRHDPNWQNLDKELATLRGLLADWVDRHQDLQESRLAWHAYWKGRHVQNGVEELLAAGGDPDKAMAAVMKLREILQNAPTRPLQALNVEEGAKLVEKIGNLVERITRIESGAFIPITVFQHNQREFALRVNQEFQRLASSQQEVEEANARMAEYFEDFDPLATATIQ